MLEHFHEGNMTNKSTGIQTKVPGVFVEISPDLAKERGVNRFVSSSCLSFWSIKITCTRYRSCKANELYLPMNSTDNETAINFLTGPAVDVRTNTPAYKQTKVRMEVLEVDGENPMPKANPRNKNVTLKLELRYIVSGHVQGMCI